jgi:hypothetical protein
MRARSSFVNSGTGGGIDAIVAVRETWIANLPDEPGIDDVV